MTLETLPNDEAYIMTASDTARIKRILKEHFLFQNLEEETIRKVLSKFALKQCAKGNYIYRTGQNASNFFILKSGSA
jgi:signal-transduction protein with cAMP-binding, CBS, and nucleotidyltransferase domain